MDVQRDKDWYISRIEYLAQFMTPRREAVMRSALESRTRWMTVCTENTFHPQNASALVRNCEAFGVQDIHTIQEVCNFSPNVHIVRGTDKWVDLHHYPSTASAIEGLRNKGYRIVVTSPRGDACTPETFDVAASPFAVIFGTEHAGISGELAAAADDLLTIPMCGMVESLNVSASAAILLYMLSSRLRSSPAPWGLTDEEKAEILLRWMMESVNDSDRILARFSK